MSDRHDIIRSRVGLKRRRRRWLERQHARNPRCHYCRNIAELLSYGLRGQRRLLEATLDHAVPKCLGGSEDQQNYRLACHTCNNLKDNMSEAEFIAELRASGVRED